MHKKTLFSHYTNVITGPLPDTLSKNHFPEELLIDSQNNLSTWYAPFDFINDSAKIVIVGITPGYQQATNALLKSREALLAGKSEEIAMKEAKVYASFSGPMRNNLVDMLDFAGINRLLNISTTQALFSERADLAQFTSILRYPVMLDGNNYNGTPSMVRSPYLKSHIKKWFATECAVLPRAIYIPLGSKVAEALYWLADEGIISKNKILDGLPHPSGANAERISYFLMKKSKENLSSRTNGNTIDAAKNKLLKKVEELG